MDQSILNTVKKMLGVDPEYTAFDFEIIMHINSVFSLLHQIGASPLEGVSIEDNTATWNVFFRDVQNINFVKTYMYMQVKQWWDPPQTGPLGEALNKQIEELKWRLSITEIKFNPFAYSGLNVGDLYIIDDLGDFPPDAPEGALGFDPDSGKIWRNEL